MRVTHEMHGELKSLELLLTSRTPQLIFQALQLCDDAITLGIALAVAIGVIC